VLVKLATAELLVAAALAACATTTPPKPATDTAPTTTTVNPSGATTYTVEPFDYDQTMGITFNVTQLQFGGRYCPCVKIPYPADGLHNQQGADAIWAAVQKGIIKPGDTLMGFSLGVQVISLFLSQHQLPAGVNVVLAGDTYAQNVRYGTNSIPLNIANSVTMVANEFDGWSDSPDLTTNPNYSLANANAVAGTQRLHYYANANPADPANVVEQHGNIKTVLIPTQHLPQNDYLRGWADSTADTLDAQQRPLVNQAYSRHTPSTDQLHNATVQQVPQPNPAWPNKPEPAAAVP
jgi:hypothetical protein